MSLTATPDGVLLVDKAAGMTSHDVVALVRRRLSIKKVGHCGTLDPLATGLLLLTLGRGTKIQDLLMSEDKEYEGTLTLGATTDTQDRAGQILEERPVPPLTEENVRAAFEKFRGDFYQMPPMVSAIKQGRRSALQARAPGENRRARAAARPRLQLYDSENRLAGYRFPRRVQQRLLRPHLRA
jgi:tRNA pseudouridine55 synthase